ncbi:unnamed protein product, partial [Protopolystoma xenopodis]
MITRKAGAALAAGCAAVLKVAEDAPLSGLLAARLAIDEAGLAPAGLFSCLTATGDMDDGRAQIGRLFCTDPRIRHIAFTGSTQVGR